MQLVEHRHCTSLSKRFQHKSHKLMQNLCSSLCRQEMVLLGFFLVQDFVHL